MLLRKKCLKRRKENKYEAKKREKKTRTCIEEEKNGNVNPKENLKREKEREKMVQVSTGDE